MPQQIILLQLSAATLRRPRISKFVAPQHAALTVVRGPDRVKITLRSPPDPSAAR